MKSGQIYESGGQFFISRHGTLFPIVSTQQPTIREQINSKLYEIETVRKSKDEIKYLSMSSLLKGALLNTIDEEIAKMKDEVVKLMGRL